MADPFKTPLPAGSKRPFNILGEESVAILATVPVASARDALMDLFQIPFFNVVRSRMSWLEQRQDTLAENVANASTPNYTARDVKPVDFAKLLAGEAAPVDGLRVTDPHHLQGVTGGSGIFKTIGAPDREASPDGNSVVLEDQMMKLSETQMQHEAVTGLYRKAIEMLRIAVHGQ
jgi:flagellar basal-body rod protein FlgB